MPPVKVRVVCLNCGRIRVKYSIQALAWADKHAMNEGHRLIAYRDGKIFMTIYPPIAAN